MPTSGDRRISQKTVKTERRKEQRRISNYSEAFYCRCCKDFYEIPRDIVLDENERLSRFLGKICCIECGKVQPTVVA